MATEFKVDQRSAVVEEMAEPWPMIEALDGGTAAMRKAGSKFLPQWPNEPDDVYKERLATAVLFPCFSQTATVNAAKPFARPMNWKSEIPGQVKDLLSDVDRAGTEIQAFAHSLMRQVLTRGLCGVLVDYPTVENVRTKADEQAVGARPYFATYPAQTILGWRLRTGQNGIELAQLRLMEAVNEPDGQWGETQIAQVRVLEPGRWETYRKDDKGEWQLFENGATTLERIPFVFFYGIREGFGVGRPPLLQLAHLNVEHWQSSSDQQTILHVARVPVLFARGFSNAEAIVVGANSVVATSDATAELKYVEHTGAAIDAGRQSLQDLEFRMMMAGAELTVQRPAVVTATQVDSEGETQRSPLQQIVEDVEDSLEQCVQLLGEWLKTPFKAEVELYKDFGAAGLSEKTGDLLLRAAGGGIVSRETAFKQLQRIDVVDHSVDWKEEQGRIAGQQKTDDARELEKQKAMQAAAPKNAPPRPPK